MKGLFTPRKVDFREVRRVKKALELSRGACSVFSPLNPLNENGHNIFTIDGPNPAGGDWNFGILQKQTMLLVERKLRVRLVQLINIVSPGLVLCQHIFVGFKRPLLRRREHESR
jgi:hypothetical protein